MIAAAVGGSDVLIPFPVQFVDWSPPIWDGILLGVVIEGTGHDCTEQKHKYGGNGELEHD